MAKIMEMEQSKRNKISLYLVNILEIFIKSYIIFISFVSATKTNAQFQIILISTCN